MLRGEGAILSVRRSCEQVSRDYQRPISFHIDRQISIKFGLPKPPFSMRGGIKCRSVKPCLISGRDLECENAGSFTSIQSSSSSYWCLGTRESSLSSSLHQIKAKVTLDALKSLTLSYRPQDGTTNTRNTRHSQLSCLLTGKLSTSFTTETSPLGGVQQRSAHP